MVMLRSHRWKALAIAVVGASWSASAFAQESPSLVSGIEKQYISKEVGPGDDFYLYVNDEWLKTVEIPADKSNYGSFTALDDMTIESVKAIIHESAENPKSSPQAAQVGSLYKSYMDVAGRNAAGIKPLQPMIDKVNSIESVKDWC
jgi:predicted metalloendopeptidase